jgi:tRNA pseudouridine55 synthase
MGHPVDGILLVDKAEGVISFDVIRSIRQVLPVRKVGHAGTLDPLATGLLIILLGQGTKLSQWIMSQVKVYEGTLRLGIETDTLDSTGEILAERPVPEWITSKLDKACRQFLGEIEQRPPRFSAVRVKGQRAYRLARKGASFDLPKRSVFIESLEALSADLPFVTLRVRCSAGTYVRSLFADLGKSLGTGAHLTALRRIASGGFQVESAIASATFKRGCDPAVLEREAIPLNEALPGMTEVEVDAALARKIRQGYQPAWNELQDGFSAENEVSGYVKITKENELIAVASVYEEKTQGIKAKLVRVFL